MPGGRTEASDLEAEIVAGTAPLVLDVRTRWEFRRGHIPGARHFPFWRALLASSLPCPPETPIVLYCGHGPRAWMAGMALRVRGATAVRYLRGHMAGWRRARPAEQR